VKAAAAIAADTGQSVTCTGAFRSVKLPVGRSWPASLRPHAQTFPSAPTPSCARSRQRWRTMPESEASAAACHEWRIATPQLAAEFQPQVRTFPSLSTAMECT